MTDKLFYILNIIFYILYSIFFTLSLIRVKFTVGSVVNLQSLWWGSIPS